jgi:hypothetical protein
MSQQINQSVGLPKHTFRQIWDQAQTRGEPISDSIEPLELTAPLVSPAIEPESEPSGQLSLVGRWAQNWKDILWREWRHCQDEEYAQYLFNLIGPTFLGWGSTIAITLTGTLYGLLAGYLLGLIAAGWNTPVGEWVFSGARPLLLAWLGGVIGGIASVWVSRQLSWRKWLALLTPRVFANKMGGLGQSNIGLIVGFIAGLLDWGIWLGGVLGGVSVMLSGGRQGRSTWVGAVAGVIGAIVGAAVTQGGWPGIGLGLALGGWLGITWGSIPLGVLIGWLGILLGTVVFGLGDWLVSWLSVGVGFGLGTIPNVIGRGIDFADAYRYRSWYFWWRRQPSMAAVEAALRLAQNIRPQVKEFWARPLCLLKEQKEQPRQPDALVAALRNDDWVIRFTAWHALVDLGGEATEPLRQMALERPGLWQGTAFWLLTRIERETANRFAWRLSDILCPHCLTRFGPRPVNLSWGITFTYYGCRVCGQSREFLEHLPQVVAVLDADWSEAQRRQESQLRLNWLIRRELFDFDRVEILHATDEDVERFAVQVGNDTDPFRQPRYQQMRCLMVGPKCRLSENTLRILRRMFGSVEWGR